jgi:hypothetical protein
MNNDKIIFLDIDGVLNCQEHYEELHFADYKDSRKQSIREVKHDIINNLDYYKRNFSLSRIEMLNDLVDQTGAKVVLSASMRKRKTIDELNVIFKYCGATFSICDKTDNFGTIRGLEIQKWIDTYNPINWAILDDNDDMLPEQLGQLYLTTEYYGLTLELCKKIKKQLNETVYAT